jgi:hypothetical protein
MGALSAVPKSEPEESTDEPRQRPTRRVVSAKTGSDRITFGDLARFACPYKTAAWLAHIAKCEVRTAERWLEGKHEPPMEMLGAVMAEIMRRFNQRIGE